MVFKGTLEEYLFVSEIVPERMYMFNKDLKTGLSVIWNIGTKAEFIIDSQPIAVKKDCFLFLTSFHTIQKIEFELHHTIDKHSCTLIATNIELLLNYCVRFYDRQFITRNIANKDILTRFENLLNNYFESELPLNVGFPTVKYCAEQLHLSSNYFGDLIRKETGKTAQDYVQHKIINLAKERIFDSSKSVSEIAYELGFQYPQHFSRFFKKKTGFTPNEYRLKH